MTKSIRAPPGSFFVTFGGFLEASGTPLGSFWTPWPPLGRLRALILNWFVMDFICFLHTCSRLHNCLDFDLYVHAFRCHGRAKINVFITVLQLMLFKFRRIQKPSQESLGNTRVSIDRLWSFLWHISACQINCWFNGVWGGGEEHYLTYLDLKSNQSISTFINWHGADLLCNLNNINI